MKTATNTIQTGVSYSDNSHISGKPVRIIEHFEGHFDVPFSDRKTDYPSLIHLLEKAGIEIMVNFVEANNDSLQD